MSISSVCLYCDAVPWVFVSFLKDGLVVYPYTSPFSGGDGFVYVFLIFLVDNMDYVFIVTIPVFFVIFRSFILWSFLVLLIDSCLRLLFY